MLDLRKQSNNLIDLKNTETFINDKLSIYLPCMLYNDEKKILKTLKIFTCFVKFRKYLYAIKILEHLQKKLTTEVTLPPLMYGNDTGKTVTAADTETVLKFVSRYNALIKTT